MTLRTINPKLDALFVEGPDDGAVVNAFVKKTAGIDLAIRPYLVRTHEGGGGASWALAAFDEHVQRVQPGGRVGVIIDRDGTDGRPDSWFAVRERLSRLGQASETPAAGGAIVEGRFGIWMWPDNVTVGGDLESFVAGLVPSSPALLYAAEVSRVAKEMHGAEYDPADARKAALKVRSVWRDASAAGGYGHLVRNLELAETAASRDFLAWFTALFLT